MGVREGKRAQKGVKTTPFKAEIVDNKEIALRKWDKHETPS